MLNLIKRFLTSGSDAEMAAELPPDIGSRHGACSEPVPAPYSAESQKEQGDAYLASGDFIAAEACYQRAIALNPNHAKAHANLGFALKEQGRLQEAQSYLRRSLEIDEGNADAHFMLGTIARDQGDLDVACERFDMALRRAPDFEIVYPAFCLALFQNGRVEEAKEVAIRGLSLNPEWTELHGYLGNLYFETGRMAEAIECFRTALMIEPARPDLLANLGLALLNTADTSRAIDVLRERLSLDPDNGDAYNDLGNALSRQNRLNEAVACFRKGIAVELQSARLHCNLGLALHGLNEFDSAVACFKAALEIDENYGDAHNNLGNTLQRQGQSEAAIACYRAALRVNPTCADAYSNFGNILRARGRIGEAIDHYNRAIDIDPRSDNVYANLGNAQLDLCRYSDAMSSYRQALKINTGNFTALSNLLFAYNFEPDQGAALLAEAREYGDVVAAQAQPCLSWTNSADAKRRLRVGFVSGDLRRHPVGYFVEGLVAAIAQHHSRQLEIFAYPTTFAVDEVSERIKSSCSRWCTVFDLTDAQFAGQIHADEIDVLIDLSGHTAHNRLPVFAWKAAPVQVSWLGNLATTGVAAIDYLIADSWTVPQGGAHYFTEQILRMPESCVCFTPQEPDLEVSPAPCLENGYVTFGSFNNLAKINDAVVALWARVLQAVPGSRLFFKHQQFGELVNRRRMIVQFEAHGIDEGTLIFEGFTPDSALFSYAQVDIALDSFPYPGVTTTVEALWSGVPVLTMSGNSFLGRIGVSILHNVGLQDWIGADSDDYIARAKCHAGDLPKLAALRAGMRKRIMPTSVFNASRFAGQFETALRGIWEKWCAKARS